jgi:predicted ABC-type ATPase
MNFPISEEDDKAISRMIIEDRASGFSSYNKPLFFLNAGQPGCGKTELNNITKANIEDDILECNADDLRDYHPNVAQILAEYEVDYPTITWEPACRWNELLIQEGVTRQYNILIETTLGKLDLCLGTLERMKNNGYTTHLQLLAIPSRWSWLGINMRYESNKASEGSARMVSDNDHEDRFQKLLVNLPTIINSPNLDKVSVYSRKLTVASGAKSALSLLTDQKKEALSIFNEVIYKEIGVEESQHFLMEGNQVIQFMRTRKASKAEIELFEKKLHELKSSQHTP